MKKKITLAALVYVLFVTPFNSALALTYATLNMPLNDGSKSVVANSNTIWVPNNYTTIQEAIDNASERDTIIVRAGTYYENVVVDKVLSLVGENKHDTIIDGRGTGIVVSVEANNITLRGFTIQSSSLGIWLDGSTNSILSDNIISSNIHYGIWLYHSSNNVLTGNDASNNRYGILVSDSDNNVLTGNDASNNDYGIYLDYASNNVLTGNDASNNRYGTYFFYSDNNTVFHNNFINNTEPPSSMRARNSADFFDRGIEGNYWSEYNGTDADWDGIGDKPYPIDENSQDNYPLMGPFSEFDVKIEDQSYTVDTVCNSSISNFQCYYDTGNQTNVISFMVKGTEGKGFCRICVPHTLIEPPYTITIDHNPLLDNNTVFTNGTHTWLYFTYNHSEYKVTIIHAATPLLSEQLAFWFEWWFWTIITLAAIVVVLLLLAIKQKKAIQAYERELGSHLYGVRALFKADVEKRRAKIEYFKRKYNMEIRTVDTLEDFFKRWEFKKKVKH